MSRLRNCPFCNKEVDEFMNPHFNGIMRKWVLSHYCDGTNAATIDVYGFTEQDCVDKWNGVYEEQVE